MRNQFISFPFRNNWKIKLRDDTNVHLLKYIYFNKGNFENILHMIYNILYMYLCYYSIPLYRL